MHKSFSGLAELYHSWRTLIENLGILALLRKPSVHILFREHSEHGAATGFRGFIQPSKPPKRETTRKPDGTTLSNQHQKFWHVPVVYKRTKFLEDWRENGEKSIFH